MEIIVAELISRVQKHRGDWPTLAEEADVSYSWLAKFGQGHIPNPTLGTVTRLAAALDRRTSVSSKAA